MIGRHLESCAECRNRTTHFADTRYVLNTLSVDALDARTRHLSYRQVAQHIDGQSSAAEHELVVAHLEDCSLCRLQVDDLNAFKFQLENKRLAEPAGETNISRRVTKLSSLQDWFLSWSGGRVAGLPLSGATTAVAFFVLAAGILIYVLSYNRWNDAAVPTLNSVSENKHPATVGKQPNGKNASSENIQSPVVEGGGEDVAQTSKSHGDKSIERGIPLTAVNSETFVRRGSPAPTARGHTVTSRVSEEAALNKAAEITAGLRTRRRVLLGQSDDGVPFALIKPHGTAVANDRPTFEWMPLAGADSYTVSVFDSEFEMVGESGPLTVTRWTMRTPLRRGRTYSWQVTAFKNGKEITSHVLPATPAKFLVINAKQAKKINAVKRSGISEYKVALSYLEAGLLDEAADGLTSTILSNPSDSRAGRTLERVRQMRR